MADPAPEYSFADDEATPDAAGAALTAQVVADYLADMIGGLESLARTAGLDLVSYLLSMARSEAELQARERD